MAKHSLGPWRLVEWKSCDTDGAVDACGYQVIDAESYAVSAVTLEGDEVDGANARLIAAAPDLLAAVQRLLSCDIAENRNIEGSAGAIKAARAAIAKATGAS